MGLRRLSRAGTLMLAFLPGASPPAAAQEPRSHMRGEALAHLWCAPCHRIDARSTSASFALTPGFAEIAGNPAATAASLAHWMSESHTLMPDLRLSERERAELADYILSLRPRASAPKG